MLHAKYYKSNFFIDFTAILTQNNYLVSDYNKSNCVEMGRGMRREVLFAGRTNAKSNHKLDEYKNLLFFIQIYSIITITVLENTKKRACSKKSLSKDEDKIFRKVAGSKLPATL